MLIGSGYTTYGSNHLVRVAKIEVAGSAEVTLGPEISGSPPGVPGQEHVEASEWSAPP